MSNLKATIDKDIIIYAYNNIVGLDKKKVEKNRELSEFYNPKSKIENVRTEVINPTDVLTKIKKKLTSVELFVLTEYLSK